MTGCNSVEEPGFFLNVLKPRGVSSARVVAAIKRAGRYQRVGHAGTLDPLAQGVLPIAVGRATRLTAYLHRWTKSYVGVVMLGIATITDDLEGEIVRSNPVHPAPWRVRAALLGLLGRQLQRPPAYSAAKVRGRRAYAVARGGGEVDLRPKAVVIHAITLRDVGFWGPESLAGAGLARFIGGGGNGGRLVAALEITCSTGTYVRGIARDLGEMLGVGACLAGLWRTRVGPFRLGDGLTLWEAIDAAERGYAHSIGYPPDEAATQMPGIVVGDERSRRFRNGGHVQAEAPAPEMRVYDLDGAFLGIGARAEDGLVRPRLVTASA